MPPSTLGVTRPSPPGVDPPSDATERAVWPSARVARWIVATETATMAVLVVVGLGSKSIGEDEAYTWSTVARSWGSYFHLVRGAEAQNALYTTLMHPWASLGSGEAWLRLPSAVFVVLAVPALYLAGRALVDRRVGVLAGLLLVVNVNAVEFGQEARAYTLVALLVALSVAGLAAEARRSSPGAWALWVASSAALVWVHPFAFAVVLAELASLVVLRPGRRLRARLTAGIGVVLVTAVPMLALLATQTDTASVFALAPPTADEIARAVVALFGKAGPPLVVAWLALLGWAALSTATELRSARDPLARWRLVTPWLLFVVPAVAIVAAAFATQRFEFRHLLVAWPGLLLVGATALRRIRSARALVPVVAVLVVLSLVGVVRWYVDRPKPDWRDATELVLTEAAPGDGVLFVYDQVRIPFEYYAQRDPDARDALVPLFPSDPWTEWGTGDQELRVPDVDEIPLDDVTGAVWVVEREPDLSRDELQRDLATLLPGYVETGSWTFDDGVTVLRFERA
jgi:mannosyltransferase